MNAWTILWRRYDFPGHEHCRLVSLEAGWQLSGTAVFLCERQPCLLNYTVNCDLQWLTRCAAVSGWVGSRSVNVEVAHHSSGPWRLNGRECQEVADCIDVDLSFSPATNLLPVRRLALEVGQSALVKAAWLRFPRFALEPLEQSYTRLEENVYRYQSGGGRFEARIDVDDAGLVTNYGDIWSSEGSLTNIPAVSGMRIQDD